MAGETEVLGETCPGATLSGLNPDRRGGKPATNRFSYGAANSAYKIAYLPFFKIFFQRQNI
jgi:hypothetical protein